MRYSHLATGRVDRGGGGLGLPASASPHRSANANLLRWQVAYVCQKPISEDTWDGHALSVGMIGQNRPALTPRVTINNWSTEVHLKPAFRRSSSGVQDRPWERGVVSVENKLAANRLYDPLQDQLPRSWIRAASGAKHNERVHQKVDYEGNRDPQRLCEQGGKAEYVSCQERDRCVNRQPTKARIRSDQISELKA
jgi:hypothetical protein